MQQQLGMVPLVFPIWTSHFYRAMVILTTGKWHMPALMNDESDLVENPIYDVLMFLVWFWSKKASKDATYMISSNRLNPTSASSPAHVPCSFVKRCQRAQKARRCEFSRVYSYSHLKDSHGSTFFYLYLRDNLSRRQISRSMEWKKKKKKSHHKTIVFKSKSGIKTHLRVRCWKEKDGKAAFKTWGVFCSDMTEVFSCAFFECVCFCLGAGTLAVEHTASPSDQSLSALQELQTAPAVLWVHRTWRRLKSNWSEWWRDIGGERELWQERGGGFKTFKPDCSCCVFLACRW